MAKCYKLTSKMGTIWYGARMYHYFQNEEKANKKLKNFHGIVEEQKLSDEFNDSLDELFNHSREEDFSLIIPDGKKGDKLTPEDCLLEALKK